MTPFFSIIIPVYNVAPYLRECLDSVLAQTFTDWEAICVDDGSTDDSGAILDEYAAKDNRFKVFHQKNAGVSVARNTALSRIRGEWFLFLDGDDRLRPDGLAVFVPYISNAKVDGILLHPYVPYWKGGVPPRKVETKVLVENAAIDDLIFGPYAANGFVISRVYRQSVFGNLRFPVGVKMAEDVHFWFDALCVKAKWMILNAEYYLYRQRADSVCGRKSVKDCEAILDSVLYACGRVSNEMGLGALGGCRYIKRWPFSPLEYLRIYVAGFNELSVDERHVVINKAWQIKNLYCWPFTRRIQCELWLIERHLFVLLPICRIFWGACTVVCRGIRLLCHVRDQGVAFAFGKVKRFILGCGEYTRNKN